MYETRLTRALIHAIRGERNLPRKSVASFLKIFAVEHLTRLTTAAPDGFVHYPPSLVANNPHPDSERSAGDVNEDNGTNHVSDQT